jgi:hypothetical protein
VIFGVMDAKRIASGNDTTQGSEPAVDHTQRLPGWTIGRLIELLDEAIDAAGAQMARSAWLWADSVDGATVAQQPPRSARRRLPGRRTAAGPWSSMTESLEEGSLAERELELP